MESPADSSPILDWEESAQEQVFRRDAGGAWGRWLASGWDWDVFATLTFSDPKEQGSHTSIGWALSDRLYREWVGRIEERTNGTLDSGVYWARAREPHQMRRSTHFHALIGGVGNLRRTDMWEDWFRRNGQARIEPVATKGATYYVAKYVNKTGGELVFSDNAAMYQTSAERERQRYERERNGS